MPPLEKSRRRSITESKGKQEKSFGIYEKDYSDRKRRIGVR